MKNQNNKEFNKTKDDDFTKFLQKHKKESLFLINPEGNSGDVLIRKGLEQYLKKNEFKVVNAVENAENIIIHGGGYINDFWGNGISLFKNLCKKYPNKRIITAPHSYFFFKTDFEKILKDCKGKIHLFSRDKYSFERLKKMNLNRNIRLYLANDTAFLLENTNYLKGLRKKAKEKYILVCLRNDRESRFLNKKKLKIFKIVFNKLGLTEYLKRKDYKKVLRKFIQNNQLQNKGKIIIADVSLKPYEEFINLILNASKIYTDRLHVGILGALLGKKVYFYAASYKKIEGVYEQTLKKYPRIIKRF